MSVPIGLHPENPRYFLYKGRPLALITATEHYGAVINRNFDYVAYLDDIPRRREGTRESRRTFPAVKRESI